MIENGISKVLVKALRTLHTNIRSNSNVYGVLSESSPITKKGLRQLHAVAPTLCNIYLNSTLNLWRSKYKNMAIFIDTEKLFILHFVDD